LSVGPSDTLPVTVDVTEPEDVMEYGGDTDTSPTDVVISQIELENPVSGTAYSYQLFESNNSGYDPNLFLSIQNGQIKFDKIAFQGEYGNLSEGESLNIPVGLLVREDGTPLTSTYFSFTVNGVNEDPEIVNLDSSINISVDDSVGTYEIDSSFNVNDPDRNDVLDVSVALDSINNALGSYISSTVIDEFTSDDFSLQQNSDGTWSISFSSTGKDKIDDIMNVIDEGETFNFDLAIFADDYVDSNNDDNLTDDENVGGFNQALETVNIKLNGNKSDSGGDQPSLTVVDMDFGLEGNDFNTNDAEQEFNDGDDDNALTKAKLQEDADIDGDGEPDPIKIGTFKIEGVSEPDSSNITLKLYEAFGVPGNEQINNALSVGDINQDGTFDVYLKNSADAGLIQRLTAANDGSINLVMYVLYDISDIDTQNSASSFNDPYNMLDFSGDGTEPTNNGNYLIVGQAFDLIDEDFDNGGGDQPSLTVDDMNYGLDGADDPDDENLVTDDGNEDDALTSDALSGTSPITLGTFKLDNVGNFDSDNLTAKINVNGATLNINSNNINTNDMTPNGGVFSISLSDNLKTTLQSALGTNDLLDLSLEVNYQTEDGTLLSVTQNFDLVNSDNSGGGDPVLDEIADVTLDEFDGVNSNDLANLQPIGNVNLENPVSGVSYDYEFTTTDLAFDPSNFLSINSSDEIIFDKVSFQNLYGNMSEGELKDFVITLNAKDGDDVVDSEEFQITVNGVNENPILVSNQQIDIEYSTITDDTITGQIYPYDIDRNDDLVAEVTFTNTGNTDLDSLISNLIDSGDIYTEQNPDISTQYFLKISGNAKSQIDDFLNNQLDNDQEIDVKFQVSFNDYYDADGDGALGSGESDFGNDNVTTKDITLKLTGQFVPNDAPEIVDFGDNPDTPGIIEDDLVIGYNDTFNGEIDIAMDIIDDNATPSELIDSAEFTVSYAGNNFPLDIPGEAYAVTKQEFINALKIEYFDSTGYKVTVDDQTIIGYIEDIQQNLPVGQDITFDIRLKVNDGTVDSNIAVKTVTIKAPEAGDTEKPVVEQVDDAISYDYQDVFDNPDDRLIDDLISITDGDTDFEHLTVEIIAGDSVTEDFIYNYKDGSGSVNIDDIINALELDLNDGNSSLSWTEQGGDLIKSILDDLGVEESLSLNLRIKATDPQGNVSDDTLEDDININLSGPTFADISPQISDLSSTMGGEFYLSELDTNDKVLMFNVTNVPPNYSADNISIQAMAVEDTGDGSSDTYFYYNMDPNGQTSTIPGNAFTVEKITQGQWDGWFTVQLTQQAIDHMKDQGLTENEIMELRFTVNAHHPDNFGAFDTANTYTGYMDHVKIHGADMPQATMAQSVDDPDIDDPDQDDVQDPAQQAQQSSGNNPVAPTSSTIIDILQPLEFYSESELDTDFMLTSFEVMDGSDPVDLGNIQVVINTMEIGNSTNQADFTFGFNSDDPSIDNYLNVEFNQNTGAYEVYFMQEAIDMIADSLDEGEYMRSHVEIQAVDSNGDTVVETSQVGFYVEGEDDDSSIDTSDDPDSGNGNNGGQLSNLMTMEYLIDQGYSADDDLGISWDDLGSDPSAKDDYFTALDMFGSTDIQLYSSVGQNGSNKLSLTGSSDDDSISVDQNSTIQIDGIDLNDDDII
jgi:hypothetical protein